MLSQIHKKISLFVGNCFVPSLRPIFLFQLEDLEKETVKWCREILRNSPTAIRVLKAALNAVDDGHAGLQVPPSINLLSLFPF